MTQTRLEPLIETVANIVIGFVIALASQLWIFNAYDIHVSGGTHVAITAWFTLVSLIRGYAVRRYFNARLRRLASALARSTN